MGDLVGPDHVRDDGALVAAMVRRDPAGLDGAYRRYAARLFEYARSVLGDPVSAADAVHDAFVLAGERADQLRDPQRLRSWLYAIVRNECLRQLRRRGRTAPMPEDFEPVAAEGDPSAAAERIEVRALVRAAAAALNPGDREVIELALRHGLAGPDVAAALGVSDKHAHARISRARAQLEVALGALLVARAGVGRCPALDQVIGGWDGRLTVLVRKRISRHLRSCEACAQRRRELFNPAALLSAYAALPFAAVLDRSWPSGAGPAGAGHAGTAPIDRTPADRVPADRVSSGPVPTDQVPVERPPTQQLPSHAGSRGTLIAAGVVVAIVVAVVAVVALTPQGSPTIATSPAAPPTALASASPRGIGLAGAAPATPTDPARPASPDTPTPSVSPAPFVVTAKRTADCTGGQSYSLTVTATATGELASAVLHWRSGVTSGQVPMVVNGQTAQGIVRRLTRPRVRWSVTATAVDGRTASSPSVLAFDPCPPS